MALPTSPSVVVIENDLSIYTPNVQSSVVGIVGFADKGPIDTPKLITSQENLIAKFGKPNSDIPGQGLEGALEILEATNQIYFVRAASSSSNAATASATIGACPSVKVQGFSPAATTTIIYTVVDNYGTVQTNAKTLAMVSGTGYTTSASILKNYFGTELVGNQDVFVHVDDNENAYLASRYAGSGATLYLSSTATMEFSAITPSGYPVPSTRPGAGGSVSSTVTASGMTAAGYDLSLVFYSKYHGSGYNLSALRDGTVQGLTVELDNVSTREKLTVNSDGSAKEVFSVELSPSSPASVEFLLINDDTNSESDYVYAVVEGSGAAVVMPDQFGDVIATPARFNWASGVDQVATPRFVKPIATTHSFTGGESGYSTTEAGDTNDRASLIGTAALKTGLYALDDDSLNISLALVPGVSHQAVQNALITLAESSKNFVAIVAPPVGYDEVQDAVDWMNGKETRTAAINNSYAAVYWPWVQVFNAWSAADEWFDPAIFAARQYVFTDNVAEPWFAPAGFRRGGLTKPVDVEVALNQGDKDVLYSNNVNPISKELQAGITVFGQKTAQRLPTALDRVNVRRLMIYIRKVLLQLGKPFQFEPNDSILWEQVEEALRPFIDDLLARRAIVEGDVKCDSSTNTPLRVDRNEMWCSVTIKPTKAAETVVFEVNLTNQSATING